MADSESNNEGNVIAWFRALHQVLTGPRVAEYSWCDCMDMATQSVPDPEFQRIGAAVASVARLGIPLSKVMEIFPNVFSPHHVAVVRYGEMYGEVDLTLERYVDRPEERARRCPLPPSG